MSLFKAWAKYNCPSSLVTKLNNSSNQNEDVFSDENLISIKKSLHSAILPFVKELEKSELSLEQAQDLLSLLLRSDCPIRQVESSKNSVQEVNRPRASTSTSLYSSFDSFSGRSIVGSVPDNLKINEPNKNENEQRTSLQLQDKVLLIHKLPSSYFWSDVKSGSDMYKLISYQAFPITKPILKIKKNKLSAIDSFKKILIFIDKPVYQSLADSLCKQVSTNPEICDEIFFQLFKQINCNQNLISVIRCWVLVVVMLTSCRPSEKYLPAFVEFSRYYIRHNESKVALLAGYADWILSSIINDDVFKIKLKSVTRVHEISIDGYNPFKVAFNSSVDFQMMCASRNMFALLETYENVRVPPIVQLLCNAIKKLGGYNKEGIFRISPSQNRILRLRKEIEESLDPTKIDFKNPETAADLLKFQIRSLSIPLIPFVLFEEYALLSDVISVQETHDMIQTRISSANQETLKYLMVFMAELAKHEEKTRMSCNSLALVMAPNIIRTPKEIKETKTLMDVTSLSVKLFMQLIEAFCNDKKIDEKDCKKNEEEEDKLKQQNKKDLKNIQRQKHNY